MVGEAELIARTVITVETKGDPREIVRTSLSRTFFPSPRRDEAAAESPSDQASHGNWAATALSQNRRHVTHCDIRGK
jgi:hypothetical protein